jgi:hypothetical protein
LSGLRKETRAYVTQISAYSGSVTATQMYALNELVNGFIGVSFWDSVYAVYPFPNASSSTCRFNLRTPQTYSITFVNTVAGDFTANGWTGNGTNSYANTFMAPSSTFTLNTTALHGIISTSVTSSTQAFAGCTNSASQAFVMRNNHSSVGTTLDMYNTTAGTGRWGNTSTATVTIADFIWSRPSSTITKIFVNGVEKNSGNATGGSLPTQNIYLLAVNSSGTAGNFNGIQTRGVSIMKGIYRGDRYYLIWRRFNKKLNRSLS